MSTVGMYLGCLALVAFVVSVIYWRSGTSPLNAISQEVPLDDLPEGLVEQGTAFEARGYGPMHGRSMGPPGRVRQYKIVLTDPTQTFDLRMSHAIDETRRVLRTSAIVESQFAGGMFATSSRVPGHLLPTETVQTLRNGRPDELIAAHQAVLSELATRGTTPLDLEPTKASVRVEEELAAECDAIRSSVALRLRHVGLMWRDVLHWPELRAPAGNARILDELATQLGTGA